MLKVFNKIAKTLGDQGVYADAESPPELRQQEDLVAQCELIHMQFRGNQQPIPIARDAEQLRAAIEVRCRVGLAEMMQRCGDDPEVEYAGYALVPYRYPMQRTDFTNPGLINRSRSVADQPPENPRDDYLLDPAHCFDRCLLAGQYPRVWGVSTHMQDDYAQRGYVLGPVIRRKDDDPDIDDHTQYENMEFDLSGTVFIPGDMLVELLRERYPELRERQSMRQTLPHTFLTERFSLAPPIDRFTHEWLAIRQEWENTHDERQGEE